MSDKQDDKLERMLRSRRLEPARADLAQRIILRARQIPQDRPVPLRQWLRELFAEYRLPKPAYVLAGTLLVGVILGVNIPDNHATDDPAAVPVQEFLYGDEVALL